MEIVQSMQPSYKSNKLCITGLKQTFWFIKCSLYNKKRLLSSEKAMKKRWIFKYFQTKNMPHHAPNHHFKCSPVTLSPQHLSSTDDCSQSLPQPLSGLTEGVAHRQTENISGLCCAERKKNKKTTNVSFLLAHGISLLTAIMSVMWKERGDRRRMGRRGEGRLKVGARCPGGGGGGEKDARWKRRRMQEWALARSLDQMKERAKEASVREEASTYSRFPTDMRRVTGKFQRALLHREWHLPTKPDITDARKKEKHLTRR